MGFELNSIIQAQTTVAASGASAWRDTGNGTPNTGQNLGIIVNDVVGNPQVLFRVATSQDQVTAIPCAYDDKGPINTLVQRNIHFATDNRYYRLEWEFLEQPGGGGSSNSSSLSGQSFNSLHSGGSSPAISFVAGITIASTG